MSVLRFFPWKRIARRAARRSGFVDPIGLFDRMREFAQPSEVGEPIELLRAGAVFHARGLVNRAIQFNLDWVWPYWVERQFNPADESFVPRAFAFSHINLTHRNWTAVGLPNFDQYSIVDPRGLVTPLFDGWSIDFWLVSDSGQPLILPSRTATCEQSMEIHDQVSVTTRLGHEDALIETVVSMQAIGGAGFCVIKARAKAAANARLVLAVRPYNPEGISFVDAIEWRPDSNELRVNRSASIIVGSRPERVLMSCYSSGDVLTALCEPENGSPRNGVAVADGESVKPSALTTEDGADHGGIVCRAGMATAAAIFKAGEGIEVRVPLAQKAQAGPARMVKSSRVAAHAPAEALSSPETLRSECSVCAALEVPNRRWKQLYDEAVATLILHAPGEVYPGPYTYKRFWYRDAAFILNALSSIGAHARSRRALDLFPRGQLFNGYFRSQEGEWDSNGEVLWIIERCFALNGEPAPADWADMIERGARWIIDKRMPAGSTYPGLLPAGFSAEHLGLNDYYYWDDFWGAAGLEAAAGLLKGKRELAEQFQAEAKGFLQAIETSLSASRTFLESGSIPAAPGRRMDSGAVGSLVADYPLLIFPAADARILKTVEWLMRHSFVRGGFYQNMIHSGINAYLTLHVAQVLLRAGDARALELLLAVSELASPTGQWPEAIHPRTLGGCMGDGQHVWAAAEWVMAMKNIFVREEKDHLVLCSGIDPAWLELAPVSFGPAATRWGSVTIHAEKRGNDIMVDLAPRWHGASPELYVRLRGHAVESRSPTQFRLRKSERFREGAARNT